MLKKVTSKKILREFGLFIGLGLPIFIGWLLPLITSHSFRLWTVWLGLIVLIIGIFFPKLLYFPYKFWIKLGDILGWINSRIVLAFVFIVILQPIAFFMKIFRYDPLRKKKLSSKTYREIKIDHKIDLTRIF